MSVIEIVRGDKNFTLEFTIYDIDGALVDLTDVSEVKLKLKDYKDGRAITISGVVVGDPSNGQVTFPVKDEFIDITGQFKAEIEITYHNGCILTAPNIVVRVIPDIK